MNCEQMMGDPGLLTRCAPIIDLRVFREFVTAQSLYRLVVRAGFDPFIATRHRRDGIPWTTADDASTRPDVHMTIAAFAPTQAATVHVDPRYAISAPLPAFSTSARLRRTAA